MADGHWDAGLTAGRLPMFEYPMLRMGLTIFLMDYGTNRCFLLAICWPQAIGQQKLVEIHPQDTVAILGAGPTVYAHYNAFVYITRNILL